jgi:hypothetical protein
MLNDTRRHDGLFGLLHQDGTVLCECANKIVRGSVQHVNTSPEKQFMKMQNINQFLEALSTTFKLKDSQIFAADQLYYASNFAKVSNGCLSPRCGTISCQHGIFDCRAHFMMSWRLVTGS